MQYAVIATGGKQYQVSVGTVVNIEKIVVDKEVVFDQVLLVVDGDSVQLGTPTVEGVKVYAEKLADTKGEKIEVFKFKSKSRYRKHTGHRQSYTQVKITSIGEQKATPKKATPKKAAK